MDKMRMQTVNKADENYKKLAELFPNAVTETIDPTIGEVVRAIDKDVLMQEINTMDLPDEIKDKFWTLTVYFNSLKDLGKCSTLVDDDVKDFIKRTAYRLGNAKDARMIARADE